MRVVVRPEARAVLRKRGTVYLWPRAYRCCRGRQYVLEAAFERPAGSFDLVHAVEGFRVYATPGLAAPEELHVEVDRSGRVQAYWNGQAWIG